jgi:hypothetical protein
MLLCMIPLVAFSKASSSNIKEAPFSLFFFFFSLLSTAALESRRFLLSSSLLSCIGGKESIEKKDEGT